MKSIIKIENVWKTYEMGENKVHALRGLTLDIKQGEFVSIMGPSGSGKSTAMNLIGCLDRPTSGRVLLDGINISKLTESELAKIRGKKIGFIFQKFNLIPTLSARENVMLPMDFQDIPKEIAHEKAGNLLTMLGLGERLDHLPGELSGGQQQRVAIARSLANDPEVILADEPTGNLDSKTGGNVMEFLDELHKTKGTTIIMVTHDAQIAKKAKKTYNLKDGLIVGGTK